MSKRKSGVDCGKLTMSKIVGYAWPGNWFLFQCLFMFLFQCLSWRIAQGLSFNLTMSVTLQLDVANGTSLTSMPRNNLYSASKTHWKLDGRNANSRWALRLRKQAESKLEVRSSLRGSLSNWQWSTLEGACQWLVNDVHVIGSIQEAQNDLKDLNLILTKASLEWRSNQGENTFFVNSDELKATRGHSYH